MFLMRVQCLDFYTNQVLGFIKPGYYLIFFKTIPFLLGHTMITHYNPFMKQLHVANGYNGTPTFMYKKGILK